MTELPTETAPVAADTASAETGVPETTAVAGVAQAASRPGVPVWRVGKPDAFLADAIAVAREALFEIATAQDIGKYVGARSEGIRCVTHLFECLLPGYVGWEWFATVTRVSRSKDATVNEVGLLPTNDSVLAPPWVPWAERVRPEDAQDTPAQADNHHEEDLLEGEHDEDGANEQVHQDDVDDSDGVRG
ncbi:DUF3027 domain-containing protein [Arthrobacter cryoconiti]|uniref:DUF3027 domain-containing protein n=1 Tax=Arthrobacter cryoconiti TaxID=748907 RepID=A0ABV8R3H2_9MICC|nr:DUF3027 domain-containing protein [Arthrobacter cryoconiti]MCC9066820.1 DUF3027 domain-containing protein [Arthrobacter cryoconiti]